jgi:hypothetical protein
VHQAPVRFPRSRVRVHRSRVHAHLMPGAHAPAAEARAPATGACAPAAGVRAPATGDGRHLPRVHAHRARVHAHRRPGTPGSGRENGSATACQTVCEWKRHGRDEGRRRDAIPATSAGGRLPGVSRNRPTGCGGARYPFPFNVGNGNKVKRRCPADMLPSFCATP